MERGVVKITLRGIEALEENPNTINEQYLLQFPEFRKFKNI
jgi:restriction endonuclease Mrr